MKPEALLPLRDIHLPAEPGLWPPAPGAWVLGLVMVLVVAGFAYVLVRGWRRRRSKRQALDAYAGILAGCPPRQVPAAHLAAASELLRRLCRRHAPHALLLRGEDWLAFLDGGDATRPFSAGPGRILLEGPYRPDVPAEDAQAVVPLLRRCVARIAGGGHA